MKQERKKTKKWPLGLAALILGWNACGKGMSDHDIRTKIVKLQGNGYQCSGEQVTARSGQNYILSAGHCHNLADKNGSVEVITEDRRSIQRKIIAEDKFSDLLLIEGLPNLKGLQVAKYDRANQEVVTYTHGRGMDTYTTRGNLVQYQSIDILHGEIHSPEDLKYCSSMPKLSVQQSWFSQVCVMRVTETVTTAHVVPGSSGGAVLNADAELVGVVSAGDQDGSFGYLVTLYDIQRFLYSY